MSELLENERAVASNRSKSNNTEDVIVTERLSKLSETDPSKSNIVLEYSRLLKDDSTQEKRTEPKGHDLLLYHDYICSLINDKTHYIDERLRSLSSVIEMREYVDKKTNDIKENIKSDVKYTLSASIENVMDAKFDAKNVIDSKFDAILMFFVKRQVRHRIILIGVITFIAFIILSVITYTVCLKFEIGKSDSISVISLIVSLLATIFASLISWFRRDEWERSTFYKLKGTINENTNNNILS